MKARFFFGVFAGFAFACILFFFFVYFFPGSFRAVVYNQREHQYSHSALYASREQYAYHVPALAVNSEAYSPYHYVSIAYSRTYSYEATPVANSEAISPYNDATIAYSHPDTYDDAVVAYADAHSHYVDTLVA